jgi:hypothetical protein
MKDALAKAKAEGKLPIVISVQTGNEPFLTDSGGGAAGGSGGGHVVTITDYDPETGIAKMQNQWGKASSHDISAKDLFEATAKSQNPQLRLDQLEAECKSKRGTFGGDSDVNYAKEYELLSLKKQLGKISPEEYDKQLVELTVKRYERWQKNGGDLTDEQYNRESKQVMLMLQSLEKENPERAKQVKAAVAERMKKK